MLKPLIATIGFALLTTTPVTLDDTITDLQSRWVKGCVEEGMIPTKEAYCVSQAGGAARALRGHLVPSRHPSLTMLARYAMSECAAHIGRLERARSGPRSFIEEMNIFGKLASCTVYVYDAMLEEAGGEDALIKQLDDAANKKEV